MQLHIITGVLCFQNKSGSASGMRNFRLTVPAADFRVTVSGIERDTVSFKNHCFIFRNFKIRAGVDIEKIDFSPQINIRNICIIFVAALVIISQKSVSPFADIIQIPIDNLIFIVVNS
ncbi:hypothetical protein SDC9_201049 [bioreactor metagenome]|uniref:Uncharacterized protein n=1 Tax=bioreactor metagenome TaxID=1076179 RepID=A0A645IPU8_9ZZZZ